MALRACCVIASAFLFVNGLIHLPLADAIAVTFTGPLLAEILKLAGAVPKGIRLMALDGYAVELDAEALAGRTWILALTADGRPLALGGLGPAWLMHAPAVGVEVSEAVGQR